MGITCLKCGEKGTRELPIGIGCTVKALDGSIKGHICELCAGILPKFHKMSPKGREKMVGKRSRKKKRPTDWFEEVLNEKMGASEQIETE